MLKNEIGSEFWERPKKSSVAVLSYAENVNTRWFIAGRTALDHIIKDIKFRIGDFSVAMPSYFCYSMLEPFLRNGIKRVSFYDVIYRDGKLETDVNTNEDVVFIMDYFGVISADTKKFIDGCHSKGKLVISDITQSALCGSVDMDNADYSFCSYRKWFFTNASMAYAKAGFNVRYEIKTDAHYTDLRIQAAKEKSNFITGMDKSKFYLELFHSADEALKEDYIGYTPHPGEVEALRSVHVEHIANIRRNNARMIINGLSDTAMGRFYFAFPDISDNDAPLFVPLIIDNEMRGALRSYLIKNDIFCPIHWGITEYHVTLTSAQREIYNTELSLICDQRYEIDSIYREIAEVKNFFERSQADSGSGR